MFQKQGLLNANIVTFYETSFTAKSQIKTSYKLKNPIYSVPWLKMSLLVKLALAERDSKKQAFLFFSFCVSANGGPYSQEFLAETLETGDKNCHDFHCMQMSLVMSMRFILVMTEMYA